MPPEPNLLIWDFFGLRFNKSFGGTRHSGGFPIMSRVILRFAEEGRIGGGLSVHHSCTILSAWPVNQRIEPVTIYLFITRSPLNLAV